MMEKSKKPALRFQGFIDDWAEEEFGKTFEGVSNNSLSRAELNYDKGSVKNIHYGDVLIRFGELLDVKTATLPYISDENLALKYSPSMLRDGDVIIADAAEDFTVGKSTEIVNVTGEKVVSGLHTIAVRPCKPFASGYLGYFMNSCAYHNQLLPLMQGTKVLSLSKTALRDTAIRCPVNKMEQLKIGELFKHLEDLITHHQSKYDKLVTVKKAMLQKMFPQKGKLVPEIRFKGFTGDWDECEIRKKVDLENGYAFKSQYFKDEPIDVIVLTPGNVNIGGGFQSGKGRFYDVSGAFPERFKMKSGDVFVTMTDLTPSAQTLGYPAVVPNDGNTYLHNQRLGKLIDFEGDKDFLFQLLSTVRYHEQIVQTASGTTVKHTSPTKILSCIAAFPSSLEQAKIGNYFNNLDKALILHKQQFEKLQHIKKACMKKMFV